MLEPITVGAVCQRQMDQPAVALVHRRSSTRSLERVEPSADAACAGRRAAAARSSREHSTGTSVTATNSDISSENDDDDRELPEHDARDAGEEQQRHEHGDVREDRRQNRRPDFLAAVDRRRHPVLAVMLHVPERVLEHDDRRVDDHADAERQAAERHRVERAAAEVEQARTCRRPRSESTCRR